MLVEENPDNNRSPKSHHVNWVVKITGQNIPKKGWLWEGWW